MPDGTGAYVGVHIPFVGGQEESFDRKMLPVGPLRRVENAYQQRTGRWAERRGDRDRAKAPWGGGNLNLHVFKTTLPDDRCSLLYRGNGRVSYWSNDFQDIEFVRLTNGEFGGFGYLGQYAAAGSPSSKADDLTFSPSVACTDRHIIFAFLSTSKVTSVPEANNARTYHVNVLWYDINTLRIVRSESFEPAGQTTEIALELKVAATSDGIVYAGLNTKGVLGSSGRVRTFRWMGPNAVRSTLSTFTTRGLSTFDMAPAESGFWICYCSETSFIHLHRMVGNVAAYSASQELLVAPTPGTRWVFCSLAANGNENACAFGVTNGVNGVQARIRLFNGTLTTGFVVGQYSAGAVYLSYAGQDQVVAYWGGFSTSRALLNNGIDMISPTVVNTNSFPVGPAIVSDKVVGTGADALGYVPVVGLGVYKTRLTDLTTPGGPSEIPGETAAHAHLQGSTMSLVRFGDGADVPLAVGGVIVRTSAMMVERVSDTTISNNVIANVPFTSGARAAQVGTKYWVVPVEQNQFPYGEQDSFTANASFVLLENEQAIGSIFGIPWDRESVLLAGAGPHTVDDQALFFSGFTDRPNITVSYFTVVGGTNNGTWQYIAVAEYRDGAGRVWRSPPSLIYAATQSATRSAVITVRPPAGYPTGTRIVLYRTDAIDGSVFYKHSSWLPNESRSRDMISNDDIIKGEPIYIGGGVLENAPPPASRFITRTRDRVWVGLLDYAARVQASKFIRPTEGIHWSNADQFFVDIPQAVTGLATMDDVLIVFCDSSIYLVHGNGPTDLGVGFYDPPQRIPSDVGCVSPRSIVTDASGVYFMSRRGIERLSRGFSAPVFIGDSVRDVVDAHPFCLDGQFYESDKTVRWLLSDRVGSDQSEAKQAIIVFDTRTLVWSIYEADQLLGIGRAIGDGPDYISPRYPPDGMSTYSISGANLVARREMVNDTQGQRWVCSWETGEIRPAGFLAGALGRRLNVLGTFHSPVEITVQMAFDDARAWHPTWVKTWTLSALDYADGDAVTLELTLPQQKFQSARFRLSAVRVTDDYPGFDAHGITIYFDTEGAGPRRTVGKAQKG